LDLIFADGTKSFEREIPPLKLPLVILLKQERADEPNDRGVVWEDADDIGAALHLGVESLERIGRCDLLG